MLSTRRLSNLPKTRPAMSENKPPEPGSSAEGPLPVGQSQPKRTVEELLKEKAPEIFNAIPVEDRPKLAQISIEKTQISYRSGMLPEPSELAAYDTIIPNGADRIMKMSEAQSSHRIALEKTVVGSQQRQEERGQYFALIIALSFGGGGLYAALNGQPWFGGIIAGTTLVSIVGIFIYSKKESEKELSDKRKAAMPPPAPERQPPQASAKATESSAAIEN